MKKSTLIWIIAGLIIIGITIALIIFLGHTPSQEVISGGNVVQGFGGGGSGGGG